MRLYSGFEGSEVLICRVRRSQMRNESCRLSKATHRCDSSFMNEVMYSRESRITSKNLRKAIIVSTIVRGCTMTTSTEIREEVIKDKVEETPQIYYSTEEYLMLEEGAEFRSEYQDGKIIPMTGGTPNHNQIAGNFYGALNFATKGQPYRVFINDLRLWIPSKRVYTYPDVMLVAGTLELAEGRKDTITNAVMVAEVLSESTADYDRGGKFKLYRSIPSFREYVLIDQYEMHVEQFVKMDDNKWVLSEYDGADAVLKLSCVEFEMSLGEIFDRVDFESESEE
jgi:Uma2 family endonuclease